MIFMKHQNIVNEMYDLIKTLNNAAKHYYNGQEIMSDKQFDDLYDHLTELEKKTGIIFPDSPTANVGYKVNTSLAKVTHEYRSLSLDKTKDKDEMCEWLGDQNGVLSWKCDGLTVILTYENGRLINAATRGDGIVGEDVTRNALYFSNVPQFILDKRHIVIRGEAVMLYSEFERINNEIQDENKRYKNPRNMAAGAVKMLDPNRSMQYNVKFIPFELVNARELGINSFADGLIFIEHLGLEPVEWTRVDRSDFALIVHELEETVSTLPYPTDGLVVIYDDLILNESLGATQKYPRYAKAFKWQDKLELTILRDIEWSVAETGLITPIAIFDPVNLEGTTVRRASVHNIGIMRELELGIGDHIRVYKANMIIPQIHDDIEKSNNIVIPTTCPVCGEPIEQRVGKNKKSIFLQCTNVYCDSRNK